VTGNRRAYWTGQLAGWSIYAAANVLVAAAGLRGPALWRWAAGAAVTSAAGLLVSHALRRLYRRWLERRAAAVVPGVLLASALGGVAILATSLTIGGALGLLTRRLSLAEALVLAFNLGATLMIWSGFYFGFHYLERVRQARHAALLAQLEARQAQLDLLRSQLNPHFVFNCLNSVRALISEDPGRAQEAVTELASLLRYTLAADRVTTVSLAEELAVVQAYLGLERIRFEERLEVSLDVDPRAHEARIPPMLVQTLVENAIKHGVAQQPRGGTVRVSGRLDGAGLRLQVRNPGLLGRGTGVGLDNARQRLRLLYGDRARLSLAAEATGVLAEVFVPA
jgi:two-component system sensor histidine kinase AlgZ